MDPRYTETESEAQLLGSRLVPGTRLFHAAELLLHLSAWGLVTAALVLNGLSDHFAPKEMVREWQPYHWTHTTADAAVAAFLTAVVGSASALSRRPRLCLVTSAALTAALAVKLGMMLQGTAQCTIISKAECELRRRTIILACSSSFSLLFAGFVQSWREARRRSRLRIVFDPRASTSSTSGPDCEYALDGFVRRSGPERGASVGRLLGLARPERCMLGVATVALCGSTCAQMAMPTLIGRLLSAVTDPAQTDPHAELSRVTLKLVGIFAVGSLFVFWRGYLFTLAGERVVCRLRKALFAHLLSFEIGFFDENQTGELLNRLSSDTAVLQNAVTVNVSMGLRFSAQVLIAVVIVFFTEWSLTLVMLSVVPAIAIAAVLYARFVKRIGKRYQALLADASTVAQEALSSVRTVRSFGMEPKEAARYASKVQASYGQGALRAMAYGAFGGVLGLLSQCAIVLVLWYGGTLVLRTADCAKPLAHCHGRHNFDAGQLMSFLLYTVMMAAALGALSNLFGTLMSAVGSSDRIFQILDRVTSISNGGGERPTDLRGILQLREVSFSYPARSDVLVLDRVSLTIQPGTVVALCGPSGSGKSSIIQLVERFYDPLDGVITLDGVPLQELDASWWRRQAALVAQEPVLFACSVHDNITYGCRAVTADAVLHAARTANAHDFISAFPDAYATLVGERGVALSGGQKQRIAIARALLMDPRMLLLDEATSALDAESEHVVQEAIDRLMTNRTTVVVAHRLSTIYSADTICVVQKGRIAERGSHDELLQRGGLYHQLVRRQMASKDVAKPEAAVEV